MVIVVGVKGVPSEVAVEYQLGGWSFVGIGHHR